MALADRPEEIQRHQHGDHGAKEHEKSGREHRLTLRGARVLLIGLSGPPSAIRVPTTAAITKGAAGPRRVIETPWRIIPATGTRPARHRCDLPPKSFVLHA
jgi:hypothetical protein